jgi:hypothetical protein
MHNFDQPDLFNLYLQLPNPDKPEPSRIFRHELHEFSLKDFCVNSCNSWQSSCSRYKDSTAKALQMNLNGNLVEAITLRRLRLAFLLILGA